MSGNLQREAATGGEESDSHQESDRWTVSHVIMISKGKFNPDSAFQ